MGSIKSNALDNSTLKRILATNNLVTFGKKAAMVKRLVLHFQDAEDIDEEDVNNLPGAEDNLQEQIDEIRSRLSQVLEAVKSLAEGQSNLNTQTSAEENASQPTYVNNIPREFVNTPVVNSSSSFAMVENGRARTSMHDVISVLPEYDPGKDCQTSQQFIEKVESLRSFYGCDDNIVLYAIQSKLKGHAKGYL